MLKHSAYRLLAAFRGVQAVPQRPHGAVSTITVSHFLPELLPAHLHAGAVVCVDDNVIQRKRRKVQGQLHRHVVLGGKAPGDEDQVRSARHQCKPVVRCCFKAAQLNACCASAQPRHLRT